MSKKGKVLMAMSGGIDSTVAALMLHKEGYEVVGITMKTWDYASSVKHEREKETGCCNPRQFQRCPAGRGAPRFPHFILDIREEFGDFVIENFVKNTWLAARSNPLRNVQYAYQVAGPAQTGRCHGLRFYRHRALCAGIATR